MTEGYRMARPGSVAAPLIWHAEPNWWINYGKRAAGTAVLVRCGKSVWCTKSSTESVELLSNLTFARHTVCRLHQMSRQCCSKVELIQSGSAHEKYGVWTRPNSKNVGLSFFLPVWPSGVEFFRVSGYSLSNWGYVWRWNKTKRYIGGVPLAFPSAISVILFSFIFTTDLETFSALRLGSDFLEVKSQAPNW